VGEYKNNNATEISFTGTAPYTVVMENSSGEPITYTGYSPFPIPGGCTVKSFTDKTGAPGKLGCIPMTGNIDFTAQPNVPKGLGTSFEVLQQNLSTPNAEAVTYTWAAPNFNPSSGTGILYAPTTPAATGTYPVTLTASSEGYCDLETSRTVTVIDCFPSSTYTLTASASGFCAGDAGVTFALLGTEYGRSYQLYNGATTVTTLSGTGSAATFSGVMTEGIYTARVLASAGGDCEAAMSGTPVTISRNSLPAAPVIAKPNDVCLNSGNLVFTASTYSGVSLEWVSNGGGVVNNNTVTFASGAATGTKTVVARSAQTHSNAPVCYSNTVTQSAAVNPIPTISRSGGNASQTVNQNTAISAISYTASNAATITRSGTTFPSGLNGDASGSSYTIYGTPTASGTFGYSLTASVNGCTSAASVGTITVNAVVTFYSANTWSIGGYIWSDRVVLKPSNCTQTTSLSMSSAPPSQYKINSVSGIERYYYNYPCALTLCPSGWSLPTRSQFLALVAATSYTNLLTIWGAGGDTYGSTYQYTTTGGVYWSSSVYSATHSYYLAYVSNGDYSVTPEDTYWGFQVRCVKD
jgi:hypothetical protein